MHLLWFFLSATIIWFFAGIVLDAVDRVAHRYKQNGFTVGFFVLGFLSSISEFAVFINSSIDGVPQVSAGNLVGASLMLLLLVVPLMAVVGNGLRLQNSFTPFQLGFSLLASILPILFMVDGVVHAGEGVLALVFYGMMLYFIRQGKPRTIEEVIENVEKELTGTKGTTKKDALLILAGALSIFMAGDVLVGEIIYFSELFSVPASVISLLILALATNVPEVVIALRSIEKGHMEIAFGDYLGSSLANTLVFGLLALFNWHFVVVQREFLLSGLVALVGFAALFWFSYTGNRISRGEGIALLFLYGFFIVMQIVLLVGFLM